MTRRRTTAVPATAALLAAGLLLTACSGSDGGGDAIEGIDAKDQETTAPADAPTEDAATGAERPPIEIPDTVELIFENGETGDPELDAVLLDNQYYLMAVDEVFASGDLERPGLGFYAKGEALTSAAQWLAPIVEDGKSFSGTVRYHNREAAIQQEGWASVSYCVDETGAYPTWLETGERRDEVSSDEEHFYYIARLDKDEEFGVWRTTQVHQRPAEGPCV